MLTSKRVPTSVPRDLRVKIVLVRLQLRKAARDLKDSVIDPRVFHDQAHELQAVLGRLQRKRQMLVSADPLEAWCKENPSDFECRLYDV